MLARTKGLAHAHSSLRTHTHARTARTHMQSRHLAGRKLDRLTRQWAGGAYIQRSTAAKAQAEGLVLLPHYLPCQNRTSGVIFRHDRCAGGLSDWKVSFPSCPAIIFACVGWALRSPAEPLQVSRSVVRCVAQRGPLPGPPQGPSLGPPQGPTNNEIFHCTRRAAATCPTKRAC